MNPQNLARDIIQPISTRSKQSVLSYIFHPIFWNIFGYTVISMLFFGGVGFASHWLMYQIKPHEFEQAPGFWGYILALLLVFVLGSINKYYMLKTVREFNEKTDRHALFVKIGTAFIGAIALWICTKCANWFSPGDLMGLGANIRSVISSIFIFPLPFFLVWFRNSVYQIPIKQYNTYEFDKSYRNAGAPSPTDVNIKPTFYVRWSPSVNSVLELKQIDRPSRLTVGEVFNLSVIDYQGSTNHRNEPLALYNDQNEAFLWVFFKIRYYFYFGSNQPKFILGRPLQANKSQAENSLKTGDRIYAKRINVKNQ